MRKEDTLSKEDIDQFRKNLDNVKKTIEEKFSNQNIESFEPKLKLDLRGINSDYAKDVVAKLEYCSNLITAPVYVGMLGRYSHGKSTLVNCLFSLDDKTKLPEGDGIVTSKVTIVSFDKKVSSPEAYKHFRGERNESERFSNYGDFQDEAQSKKDDNSNIAYLEAKIPVDEKVVGLKTNFFQHNIQLVDMPGLGGSYFEDEDTTQKYLRIIDLVIITIKITDIKKSAESVDDFLKNINCPKIIVLTFFDKAAEDNFFSDCKDDEEILLKAKKQVKECFKNIGNANDIIAVSNSNSRLIDKVRERILSKIVVQDYGISKMQRSTPEVKQRQVEELKAELLELRQKSEQLRKQLESLVEKTVGKDDDKNVDIRNIFDTSSVKKQVSKRKKDIENEINSFSNEQKREINSLHNIEEAGSICDRISDAQIELIDSINDKFFEYVESIKDAANDYISDMNISDTNKNDFKREIKDTLSDFKSVFNDVEFDLGCVRDVIPSKAGNFIANFFGRIFGKRKSKSEQEKETREKMKDNFSSVIRDFKSKVAKKIEKIDGEIDNKLRDINLNDIKGNIKKLRGISSDISKEVIDLGDEIDNFKLKLQ
ncbi:MAG: dynamin family protein [Bacteroidales bacterium]|nr:dynamin family protein [Bacteroidales bacterium]